ncbi:Sec-independent protein translocase subunit TatA [Kitasatospora sp. NPDC057015]|uniref:Sec-independent protein translocase subunit TatA n=1 Tax=Kitasatospora sp. NPDC057015 TaxID=3346001 RepID=UPI0036308793
MFRNGLEPWHALIMLAVLILLFGSKKLPDMARGLGKSMRILKAETSALREDGAAADDATPPPAESARPAVTPAGAPTAPAPAEGSHRSARTT